jgi:hypothetical protein
MLIFVCAIASWCGKRWYDKRYPGPSNSISIDFVIAADGTISVREKKLSLRDVEVLLNSEIQQRKKAKLDLPFVNLKVAPGASYDLVARVTDAIARLNKPTRTEADEARHVFSFFISLQR